MNVLIVGSGAREHTIAWKIKQSEQLKNLYAVPGNAGIAQLATCFDGDVMDFENILAICQVNQIDLVVVGPENPLCGGLVDFLEQNGIKAYGPNQKSAMLEGSKAFSKDFMLRHNIPTANYQRFTDAAEAKQALPQFGLPVVIKADGLAAGKGVIIAETVADAERAIDDMMLNAKFGSAGDEVVIEEFLTGIEASQICFVDANTILPLAGSQDYKRALDGDKGLNTGGMGNYSPSRQYSDVVRQNIENEILIPLLKGLKEECLTYSGWLFIGLMIKDEHAKVIEFNVRFGDPEAESIIPRLDNDLLEIIDKSYHNQLSQVDLKWSKKHSVVVIMASGGYPESYQKGKRITGLDDVTDCLVFHAGTKLQDDDIVTNGGRVLAVTALADSLVEARQKAYQNIAKISFEDCFYRNDIAK